MYSMHLNHGTSSDFKLMAHKMYTLYKHNNISPEYAMDICFTLQQKLI